MEAFITGQTVVTPTGAFARNTDPRRPSDNNFNHSGSGSNMNYNNATNNELDGSDKKDGVVLAERTSQLMSSYRDFISGQEDEEMIMNRIYSDGGSAGNTAGATRRISNTNANTNANNNGSSNKNKADAHIAPLLREWGQSNTTSRCELEMEQVLWADGNNNYDDYSYDSWDKKYRYTHHPFYHSRKLKRFLLAVLVSSAIIGTIVLGVKSSKRKALAAEARNVQKLDEEMKEILDVELAEKIESQKKKKPALDLKHEDMGMDAGSEKKPQAEAVSGNTAPHVDKELAEEIVANVIDKKAEEASNKGAEKAPAEEEVVVVNAPSPPVDIPTFNIKEDNPASPQEQQQPTANNQVDQSYPPSHDERNEAITRHILCCSSNPTPIPQTEQQPQKGLRSTNPVDEQANLNGNIAAAEYARAESYHPQWYNRSNGWVGSTYNEGIAFCSSQLEDMDDSNSQMQLCPYKVYCPTGAHHIPLGGYRVDNSLGDGNENGSDGSGVGEPTPMSRSPIGDYTNGWVQVGVENVCVQVTIMGESNDDGTTTTGSNEAMDGVLDEIKQSNIHFAGSNTDQQQKEDAQEAEAPAAEGSSVQEEEQVQVNEDANTQGHDTTDKPNYSKYDQDAINDVNNKEIGLVEQVYVPSSQKKQEDEKTEQEVVQQEVVEEKDTSSKPVEEVQQDEPAAPSSQSQSSSSSSFANTDGKATATATSSKLNMTTILHQKFKPLWLSAKEGWTGGSHNDAAEYCRTIRGKQLCPYSAMCPHGPGHAVMGGRHQLEFNVEGVQYAPVLGGENHWVMIGTTENEGEMKCKTHRQLEGKLPEWGLTGDNPELKKYVMCCSI